jgi:glycosyltransferase involved in cell wall biosynthesis
VKKFKKYNFSVVTSTKNSANTLIECISSVKSQRGVLVQHIVVDSDSNDGTKDILKKYNHADLKVIIEKDNGIYEAWNKALKLIDSDWVIFLGSDDIFYNDQVLNNASIKMIGGAKIYYGKVIKERAGGNIIGTFGMDYDKYKSLLDPPTIKFPPHPATIFHYSIFRDYPLFNEEFKICADSLHVAKIYRAISPVFIPEIITRFRAEGVSNSRNLSLLQWNEKRRITKIMGYKIPYSITFISYVKSLINQIRG